MRHPVLAPLAALALLTAGAPARAHAQDVVDDVEYISGKTGFPEKMKGLLVLTPDAIKFQKKDQVVFSIPTVTITEASKQTDIRDGSVGKKLLFGGLAGSRKQEFINLSSETDSTAEGLIFKVKQGTAQGPVTKIRFYARKARAAAGLEAPKAGDEVAGSIVSQ
jgi:hypothetical protein